MLTESRIRRCIPARAPGFLCALALGMGIALADPSPVVAAGPDLILVSIDTLRADLPGCYGGPAKTPRLDALAASGVRFARALSPVPLTLPAHASLLTGLDPNQHGLRDNGQGALSSSIPTLAAVLHGAGYATVAVVGSRVLDRRFGLDRGFELYDDLMTAERTGEFGYPERSAAAVVDAALAGIQPVAPGRPLFLWVHFYDAHSPYEGSGVDPRSRYRSEVEAIDREMGRLLDAFRPSGGGRVSRPRVVALVADHGESFGEHGESEHGYLLHSPTLAVPLVLSGPGVPSARVREEPVSISRLAPTLAGLAGVKSAGLGGPALLLDGPPPAAPAAVYHETEFPSSTFGWSPLSAVTSGRWRFVLGPKPALYDLTADPGEVVNQLSAEAATVRLLRRELAQLTGRTRLAPPAPATLDDELRQQLESLGYLSGASAKRGSIDPGEGVLLLADFDAAKRRLAEGDAAGARQGLRRLVERSPESVPFLSQLAAAEEAMGDVEAARGALLAAASANPRNEFLQTSLGELELRAGRPAEAERALRQALAIEPRSLPATLALGQLLVRSGRAAEEEALVREVVAAGAQSGVLLTRLAEIELRRGDLANADLHLAEATRLLPEFATSWRLWADVARRQGRADVAAERTARALALQPGQR